ALDLLVGGKDVVVKDDLLVVPEDRRPRLDYYKNNAINWFVGESLVAVSAIALAQRGELIHEELRERTLELSRLLKLEFVYRVGVTFEVIFEETLTGLMQAGWLRTNAAAVSISDEGRVPLALLAGLVESYIETYWAASRTIAALLQRQVP